MQSKGHTQREESHIDLVSRGISIFYGCGIAWERGLEVRLEKYEALSII